MLLAQLVDARLRRAGFHATSPELVMIRQHNLRLQAKAAAQQAAFDAEMERLRSGERS